MAISRTPRRPGRRKSDGPHPTDVHVGSRVRLRRTMLGLSQEKLGEKIGLTFQQVQKYERGANRISASKLYEIARSLRVSISWFFEGLSDPLAGRLKDAAEMQAPPYAHNFLMTPEGIDLANAFPRIEDRQIRRKLVDLIRALVEEDAEAFALEEA
jgi:transcriptional regulator with XRE-family HTH domain